MEAIQQLSVLSSTGLGSSVGIAIAAASSFIASVAGLITNEYCSKLKMSYTNLRDWIKLTTVLYEKTLNKSMIDKKIDEKEGQESKKNTTFMSKNVKLL